MCLLGGLCSVMLQDEQGCGRDVLCMRGLRGARSVIVTLRGTCAVWGYMPLSHGWEEDKCHANVYFWLPL